MIDELKDLVEHIVVYTRNWSISDDEWYWAVDSVRKSEYCGREHLMFDEFDRAIREEILYDLVFRNGNMILQQMENDLCSYNSNNLLFNTASIDLEKKIQKIFRDFKIERESD